MNFVRHAVLACCAGGLISAVSSWSGVAQPFPTRPVTMIVPAAAGGPLDVIARVLSEPIRSSLGQPVVIENVGGADGSIGTGRAARARPDGYTISLGPMDSQVLNGGFYSLQYDLLSDFTPICPVATTQFLLYARTAMLAKDLGELIGWLRANPNMASIGVQGMGARLLAAFFQRETKTQVTLVPYRGTAPRRRC